MADDLKDVCGTDLFARQDCLEEFAGLVESQCRCAFFSLPRIRTRK